MVLYMVIPYVNLVCFMNFTEWLELWLVWAGAHGPLCCDCPDVVARYNKIMGQGQLEISTQAR